MGAVAAATHACKNPGMEPLDAVRKATEAFGDGLRDVGPDDWSNLTPCTEWDVRGLVNHMLLGTRMAVQLLDDISRDDVIAGLDDDLIDGNDPVAEFDRLGSEMLTGFMAEGALAGTVDHPMGEIPTRLFLSFRALDAAAHAWDLAQGIGADAGLDVDLVQWLWNDVHPMADGLADTGIFGDGASGSLDDDAPLLDRYLDVLGRRP